MQLSSSLATARFLKWNLDPALELRSRLYPVLIDYLNPQNYDYRAQRLQQQLQTSGETQSTKDIWNDKKVKSEVLKSFIEEIYSNPLEFGFKISSAPTTMDRELAKIILIYDLFYYGPITILFLTNILEKFERLENNLLYLFARETVDPERVTEVRVNSHNDIYYEISNRVLRFDIPFLSSQHLITVIERMISENNIINNSAININAADPIVDFEHPCGYIRGAAIIPPVSENPCLTLRIHPREPLTLNDLLNRGMLSPSMKDFLIAAQEAGTNIVIAGTMGSGKTTLLSALSEHWPLDGRKATIEDTPELRPRIQDLIKMRTINYQSEKIDDIDITRLTKACKRHSVRYVVLSEARDGSAWEILQLSQAILGCLMTFHYTLRSNKFLVDQAMNTLTALCKQHPLSPKGEDLKYLISSMIQILILVEQSPGDSLRRISKIYQILGYDELNGGHFKYIELFSYEPEKGFVLSNISKDFETYLLQKGVRYQFH